MADAPKLIFGSVVEALFKVARGKVSPDTQAKLSALGLPLDRKIEPAYPAETWASAVKLISNDLFPGQPPEEQHRLLGKRTVQQFADTVMGKAMFAVAKVIGAQRSLQRMTNNLRTGANFIETRFTPIDDRSHELWINDVSGVPGFYAGLVEAGSDYMEGWIDEMKITRRDGPACLYTLRRAA